MQSYFHNISKKKVPKNEEFLECVNVFLPSIPKQPIHSFRLKVETLSPTNLSSSTSHVTKCSQRPLQLHFSASPKNLHSASPIGRTVPLRPTARRNLHTSTMTNTCITQLQVLSPKVALPLLPRKKYAYVTTRIFTTSSTSLVSSYVAPLILHGHKPLVVASDLTPSDTPQRSDEWFALRKDRLTTSTFSTALGFWYGNRRVELWHEKVFSSDNSTITAAAVKAAMNWGVLQEPAAIQKYKSITGRDVSSYGFAVHPEEQYQWLGASPDGLLGCCPGGGILEVKCPYNKGRPQQALPWAAMPYYYMPQLQGQMEIMDRDWVDLYCWTPNGSTLFRVHRNREYWELMYGILRDFWWGSVVPAKEALSRGREEEVKAYIPPLKHRDTGLVVSRSRSLAAEAKMVCRDIGDHLEFFR